MTISRSGVTTGAAWLPYLNLHVAVECAYTESRGMDGAI
jgi:hypothetical protein